MFEKKSAANRMFFDSLVKEIYFNCKVSDPVRRERERGWWLDIQLPSYRSVLRGGGDAFRLGTRTSKIGFDTAAEMLSKREQKIVQEFIDRTYVTDILDAKKKFLELFNDCQLTALNDIGKY